MILVFGSYNFDVFVHGVGQLPPLDAIQDIDRHSVAPGGKGANQAVAVARAGGEPAAYGCVGDDPLGTYLVEHLERDGVETSGIVRSSGRATGMGLIFLDDGGGHRVVYVKGANAEAGERHVPPGLLEPVTAGAAAAHRPRALLLQGDVEMRENERLIERAARGGIPVVLTLGPVVSISLAALRHVQYVLFNQREAGLFLDYCCSQPAIAEQVPQPSVPPSELCVWLRKTFGAAAVVTLGPAGAVACDGDGQVYEQPALSVDVKDTVGAGDTFAGYFATAIAEQQPFGTALRRAVFAASLACREVGAQRSIPRRTEVDVLF